MTVRAGVIGLGFMGQTHARAYRDAARAGVPVELVAVCDPDEGRRAGRFGASGNLNTANDGAGDDLLFDPRATRGFATTDELFAWADKGELDLVSVCTPTDTHVYLAENALRAGCHVLVEKPVALDADAIERLAVLADEMGKVCMPAMCMRFWPAWAWLRDAVRDRRYGAVRSARFERLGARPTWGESFYGNPERSGGALFDLHVHDTDFVVALFGQPAAVESVGDRDSVATRYVYPGGPASVFASGGWVRGMGFPFRMRYLVEFERGIADFDISRSPELSVYLAEGGDPLTPELDGLTGYDHEIRAMVRAIAEETGSPVGLRDAATVTRVLHAELESAGAGGRAVAIG